MNQSSIMRREREVTDHFMVVGVLAFGAFAIRTQNRTLCPDSRTMLPGSPYLAAIRDFFEQRILHPTRG